ncbi:hypothetical protein chiPu_0030767, partial [Chiloscyllium punctatum]|nr:hypothetical protein [Chiloscyllium punctatum]
PVSRPHEAPYLDCTRPSVQTTPGPVYRQYRAQTPNRIYRPHWAQSLNLRWSQCPDLTGPRLQIAPGPVSRPEQAESPDHTRPSL